jgi:hypothetical protein
LVVIFIESAIGTSIAYPITSSEEVNPSDNSSVETPDNSVTNDDAVSSTSNDESATDSNSEKTGGNVSVPHGLLVINSEPEGANIFLDGEPFGKTPQEIPITELKTYSVRLEFEGYENWEGEVTFDRFEKQEKIVTLTPDSKEKQEVIPTGTEKKHDITSTSTPKQGSSSISTKDQEATQTPIKHQEPAPTPVKQNPSIASNPTKNEEVASNQESTPGFIGISFLAVLFCGYLIFRKK